MIKSKEINHDHDTGYCGICWCRDCYGLDGLAGGNPLAGAAGLVAWAVVYCLDKEAAQVREGLKDARTAVLPVPLTK